MGEPIIMRKSEVREGLKPLLGKRLEFEAKVSCFGEKNNQLAQSVCLTNVKHAGELVADHAWITKPKNFNIRKRQTIRFTATVRPYFHRQYGFNNIGLLFPDNFKSVIERL